MKLCARQQEMRWAPEQVPQSWKISQIQNHSKRYYPLAGSVPMLDLSLEILSYLDQLADNNTGLITGIVNITLKPQLLQQLTGFG